MSDPQGSSENGGSGNSPQTDTGASGDQQNNQQPAPVRGFGEAFAHIVEQKIDSLLWLSRISTMSFTVLYILGGLVGNPYSYYQKALISNAVTSALRLHQRMPEVRLSREFLERVLVEDSCHYLMFSMLFIFAGPMTICLMPPSLFALLQSTAFSLSMLTKLGMDASPVSGALRSLLQTHRVKVFRMIAMAEIFIMPMAIFGIFSGRCSMFTPFLYYRFLSLRYSSRRNPYSRNVFYELRIQSHFISTHPSCPAFATRAINQGVRFISNLAPLPVNTSAAS